MFDAFYWLGYNYRDVDIIGVQVTSKTMSFYYPEYSWGTDTMAVSVQNKYLQMYLRDEINWSEFKPHLNVGYTRLGYL